MHGEHVTNRKLDHIGKKESTVKTAPKYEVSQGLVNDLAQFIHEQVNEYRGGWLISHHDLMRQFGVPEHELDEWYTTYHAALYKGKSQKLIKWIGSGRKGRNFIS